MPFNEAAVLPEPAVQSKTNEIYDIVALMELPVADTEAYQKLEESTVLGNLQDFLNDSDELITPSFKHYLDDLTHQLKKAVDVEEFENRLAAEEITRQHDIDQLTDAPLPEPPKDRFMPAKMYARKIREIIERADRSKQPYGKIILDETGRLTLQRITREQNSQR